MTKCNCTGCDNEATHTWSGHPTCDDCATPTRKLNQDTRPQQYGWAPGNYENGCLHCKRIFIGDKRAVICAPCAYSDNDAETLRASFNKNANEFDALMTRMLNENKRLNDVLASRVKADEALRARNVELEKRLLCKHEGHLPISDGQGNTYCELCEEKIG